MDGVVVVLSHGAQAADVRQAMQARLRHELNATHRGVLPRPVSGIAALPSLHAPLWRALPVLAQLGISGDIVGHNELGLYSVFVETHDRASFHEFLQATIGRVLNYDLKRGTHLAATLLLLRPQPERQHHGAVAGHPRQHRATAAYHHRVAARPLGHGRPCAGAACGAAPVAHHAGPAHSHVWTRMSLRWDFLVHRHAPWEPPAGRLNNG